MALIANVFANLQTAKNLARSMSKKCRFRKPLESQHVKVSEALLKSARQHFSHNLSSL